MQDYIWRRFILSLALVMALLVGGSSALLAAPNPQTAAQAGEEVGVLIVSVQSASPAAIAGIARGDIVLAVDDTAVNTVEELIAAVVARAPGSEITLTVQRGDAQVTRTVTLGERMGRAYLGVTPYALAGAAPPAADAAQVEAEAAPTATTPAEEEADRSSSLPTGALLAEVLPDSPAAQAGLKAGDLIISLDDAPVTGAADLAAALRTYRPGADVRLGVIAEAGAATKTVIATLGASPDNARAPFLGVRFALADATGDEGAPAATGTPMAEEAAAASVTPAAEEEAISTPMAAEEATATATPVAEEEATATPMAEEATATATPGAEEEATATPMAEEATATATPAAEEEATATPMAEEALIVMRDGAFVAEVVADSPAEVAGLQPGDVILAVDGVAVDAATDLAELVSRYAPGDEVRLTVGSLEDDDEMILVATLGAAPQEPDRPFLGVRYSLLSAQAEVTAPDATPTPEAQAEEESTATPAAEETTATPMPEEEAGAAMRDGALVVEVVADSPAAAVGLQENDVIMAVDGVAVNAATDLADLIGRYAPGDEVRLTVGNLENDDEMILVATLGASEQDADRPFLGIRYGLLSAMGGLEATPDAEAPADEATATPEPEPEATATPIDEPEATATPIAEPEATATPIAEPEATATPLAEEEEGPAATATPGPEEEAGATLRDGALVGEVVADSPAAVAGLQAGDVILAVDGVAVNAAADLADLIGRYAPGDEVRLTVGSLENDDEMILVATLGAAEHDAERPFLGVRYGLLSMMEIEAGPEATPTPLPEGEAEPAFPILQEGALIAEVVADSPAATAGLQVGEIIAAVNGVAVDAENDLAQLIGQYAPETLVTLTLRDMLGRAERDVDVTLGANPDAPDRAFLGIRYTPLADSGLRPFPFERDQSRP